MKDGVELVQPRTEEAITAKLEDPDGGVTDIVWVWTRSETSPNDAWPGISIGTADTYTPTAADPNNDIGWFLRATATYEDAVSGMADRTAMETTIYSVLEVEDLKRAPTFPQADIEVEVAENSPSTTYVGDPIVVATDEDKGTTLTYTLGDTPGGDDAALFALAKFDPDGDGPDPEVDTRQIVVMGPVAQTETVDGEDVTTYPTVDLNHEDDKKNTYTVVLKASDGNDETDDATITVTITVTNRNEAPSVPAETEDGAVTTPTNNAPEFPATENGMRSVPENTATGMPIGDPVMATDDDAGDTLMYTLGGADMASFTINMATGQIMTAAALDYEAPADADMDNDYEVTVTASDGNTAADATIAVTITVTDMGLADSYDANEDGMIDSDEVLNAVEDYFNDVSGIDSERILDIVELYFSS